MIKDKIIAYLDLMSDDEAEVVYNYIISDFKLVPKKSWGDIEEVEPDEIDLAMLKSIENDPDCQEFISHEEAMKELDL